MGTTISRRSFVAAAATLATAGACAASAQASETGASTSDTAPEAARVIEADIVICGAGLSGLAAAVEAADRGIKAVCLEKSTSVGGGGAGVEGIFAVGSALQREQGIEIDKAAVFRHEMEFAQNRPDGVLWRDLIGAAAGNIDWLCEHGVEFSGLVNDYGGLFPTMHWFDGNVAAVGYVPPMQQAAENGGVEFLLETSATGLIQDGEGQVTGVIAQGPDGTVQVNARAVIVATGGFGSNTDMLEKAGWPLDHLSQIGFPGHDGDGISMCVAAGGADRTSDACYLAGAGIEGLAAQGATATALTFGGPFLWVNREGERVINEDFAASNMMNIAVPLQVQREIWCLANQATIEAALASSDNASAHDTGVAPQDEIDAAVEAGGILRGDSVEELATQAGIDSAALADTLERYNELAAKGVDEDCGKDPSQMIAINEAPYYLYRLDPNVLVTIGGVDTNRNMQVIDAQGEPIDGLYAIGVDGVRLYRHVYPINCGATCCGNNVNSGRTAVRHIAETLLD